MEPENRFFLEETGAQQSLTKKVVSSLVLRAYIVVTI